MTTVTSLSKTNQPLIEETKKEPSDPANNQNNKIKDLFSKLKQKIDFTPAYNIKERLISFYNDDLKTRFKAIDPQLLRKALFALGVTSLGGILWIYRPRTPPATTSSAAATTQQTTDPLGTATQSPPATDEGFPWKTYLQYGGYILGGLYVLGIIGQYCSKEKEISKRSPWEVFDDEETLNQEEIELCALLCDVDHFSELKPEQVQRAETLFTTIINDYGEGSLLARDYTTIREEFRAELSSKDN